MPKRSGKRKRTYKRSVDRKQNKEIKKLKSSVAKLVSVKERKFYDFATNSTVGATTSGINIPLTGIAAYQPSVTAHANIQNRRERNSCLMTGLTIKGVVSIPYGQQNPDYENVVRILVVRSNDDNGNPITFDQVLQDPADLATSFYKIDNTGGRKYDVMYDKTFFLQSGYQGVSPYNYPVEPWRKKFTIKIKVPKRGLKLEWPNSNISGNPSKNGMYLIALSDSGVVSHPHIKFYGRLRFIDE